MAGTSRYHEVPQGAYIPQYTPDEIDPNFALSVANARQNRYDQTLVAAGTAFPDFEHFPEGAPAEAAREIRAKYEQEQNNIVNDLMETGDTTSAAKRIINLKRQFDTDEDIKHLQKSYQMYNQDMENIVKQTTQPGTALIQKEKLRDAHRNLNIRDPETGAYADLPQGLAGNLPSFTDVATVVQKYLGPDSGVFRNEAGDIIDVTKVKTEDGQTLGYNMRTGQYERVTPEMMRAGFDQMMKSDPALASYESFVNEMLGEGAWDVFLTEGANLAAMGAYDKSVFKDSFIAGGEDPKDDGPTDYKNILPEDYLSNPGKSTQGAMLNAVYTGTDDFLKAAENTKEYISGSPIYDNMMNPEDQGAVSASLMETFLGIRSENGIRPISISNGTPYIYDYDSDSVVQAFSEKEDGTLRLLDEEYLFSTGELNLLGDMARAGQVPESTYKDAMQYNIKMREKNFKAEQFNANINEYHTMRNDAYLKAGGMTESEFKAYDDIMEATKSGDFKKAEDIKKENPGLFKTFKAGSKRAEDLERVTNALDDGIILYELGESSGTKLTHRALSLVEGGIAQLINTHIDKGSYITPEKVRMIEQAISVYYKGNPTVDVHEYLKQKSSGGWLEKLLDSPEYHITKDEADRLSSLYANEDFQKERKKIISGIKDQFMIDTINEEMASGPLKDKIQKGGKALDAKVKDAWKVQVGLAKTFSYAGRDSKTDFGSDMQAAGRELGYGTNALIRAENSIVERIEGEAGTPINLEFFEGAYAIYDYSGSGRDITQEIMYDKGEMSMVVHNDTNNKTSYISKIQKFKYEGMTYLPEVGAGVIVTVFQTKDSGGDPEAMNNPENVVARKIFVRHQDVENLHVDHVIKQNAGKVGADDRGNIQSILSDLNEVMNASRTNMIWNYPLPDHIGPNGERTRLVVDVIPIPGDPLRFSMLTKKYNPNTGEYEPISQVFKGELPELAITMNSFLKSQQQYGYR